MRYEDENIWLTQKMMAELYQVTVSAINQHLKTIFYDNELDENATIKKYLIVQTEGNRQVSRKIDHYNLQSIIAVGFKVNNERAVQFCKCGYSPCDRIVSIFKLYFAPSFWMTFFDT